MIQGQDSSRPLSKAELRARVIGTALERDQEDVRFWRTASDTLRGHTLYRLLAQGEAMRAGVSHRLEQENDAVRLVLTAKKARIITRDG